MAFVHDQSCECLKSELDLFSVPPTQTSIENGSWVEYHPLSTLADGSPIEYEICGSGEDYLDFANSYLHVVAKVTKADGTDLDDDEAVGPVNLFLHSLFSQIDISLNGTQITPATNTYPYRAMIETLLSYGGDAKESQLTSAFFYKDEAGRMDAADFAAATRNDGFFKRSKMAEKSHLVDMMGRIHADIFFQERYMLNEVNTKIKLIRSKDACCFMGTAGHVVKIGSAVLLVRKVKLSPSVFLAHAKALERTNAKYPIRRVVCKTFTVPSGFLDVSHDKLFSGQLPTRMVVGLVRNDAFNGALARNPFNFHHFGLNEIAVYVDGQQQQSIRPLHPNFENGQYISSYVGLFSGTGKLNKDDGNNISRHSDRRCLRRVRKRYRDRPQ